MAHLEAMKRILAKNHYMLERDSFEQEINFILKKSAWFDKFEHKLNVRQLKAMRRMMEEGVSGFEGGMSAKKYMVITGTSKATATRDLQDLLSIGAVRQFGEGRGVRYELEMIL